MKERKLIYININFTCKTDKPVVNYQFRVGGFVPTRRSNFHEKNVYYICEELSPKF